MIVFPKHLYQKCACADGRRCAICEWGAAICTRCNGAEGDLPTDCPGAPMTDDQRKAVLRGDANYHRRSGWVAEDVTAYAKWRAMYGATPP